jgi:hypothetical protein
VAERLAEMQRDRQTETETQRDIQGNAEIEIGSQTDRHADRYMER